MPSEGTVPPDATLTAGPYRVRTIVDGSLALDGGSMFGVVPKALWQRTNPADEHNRIALVSRLLYIEGEGRRILVDTGLGDRWDDKSAGIFAVRTHEGGVTAALAGMGVGTDGITDVVLTHLHFDHAAGTARADRDGALRLTFPAARHHVQQAQWEWAQRPTRKDAASFRADDFAPLQGSDRLQLHAGRAEIAPEIDVIPLDGHTQAMQAVRIGRGHETIFFPSDLVPTRSHLRWPYIMGYDNQPLVTLEEKLRWLPRAADEGWTVVFQHDPEVAGARLERDEAGVRVAATRRD